LALVGAIKHADLEAGAISSAVEHSLHTGGVAGSIPASPTIFSMGYEAFGRRSGF
jgi:hypothetical protein